mmetsp:Transcript_8489/g.20454  ORF Transcript_8489/g.20454 Transcript_8489/m.20454 type:complete len:205 (-) Transcript_8489:833-1447(-)
MLTDRQNDSLRLARIPLHLDAHLQPLHRILHIRAAALLLVPRWQLHTAKCRQTPARHPAYEQRLCVRLHGPRRMSRAQLGVSFRAGAKAAAAAAAIAAAAAAATPTAVDGTAKSAATAYARANGNGANGGVASAIKTGKNVDDSYREDGTYSESIFGKFSGYGGFGGTPGFTASAAELSVRVATDPDNGRLLATIRLPPETEFG